MRNKKGEKKEIERDLEDLFDAIFLLKNKNEMHRFFRDLLTEKEVVEFGQRWKVARMLEKGISYAKIERETGMSSTTIARIQKWLKGGMGGYALVLNRMREK